MSDEGATTSGRRFCGNCGSPLTRNDARFCANCGSPVNKSPVEASNTSEATVVTPSPPVGQSPTPQTQTQPTLVPPFARDTPYADRFGVTPAQIDPAAGRTFSREELTTLAIVSGLAYASHIFRYFLMFNTYPSVLGILIPIPLYFVGVFVIFYLQKYLMRSKGVQTTIEFDRYEMTQSLVFSTFFLTLLPGNLLINKETTQLPDTIEVPTSTRQGYQYDSLNQAEYIGKLVKPRMYLFHSFFIAIIGLFTVFLAFAMNEIEIIIAFQLFTAYLGSYVFVELVPIFGRHNKEASGYGRFRTLGTFLLGLIVFIFGLFGSIILFQIAPLLP